MPEEIESILRQAAALGREYGAQRLVLYGSRARGDHKERSDIDLAVWDMPERSRGMFWAGLEDLPTLLKFDVCHISPPLQTRNSWRTLKRTVESCMKKIDNYIKALAQLEAAVDIYKSDQGNSLYRDGLIQRFKFTV